MIRARDIRRLSRGLRFRLTATYALFFALLLIGVTGVFHERLASSLDNQVHSVLDQRWAAMKGYLRIERDSETDPMKAIWYYDKEDPDESRIVLGIRSVYLITDSNGNTVPDLDGQPAVSQTYLDIGVDSPADIKKLVRGALANSRPFWTVKRSRPVNVRWRPPWTAASTRPRKRRHSSVSCAPLRVCR